MSRTPFWQPREARRRGVLLVLALGGLLMLAVCGASAAATAGAAPLRIIFDPAATPSWSQAFARSGRRVRRRHGRGDDQGRRDLRERSCR